MRIAYRISLLLILTCSAVIVYNATLAHSASGSPPALVLPENQADMIRVYKSERRLELLREGQVIRSYEVSLGEAPVGHKMQEGDERTPEGEYIIDWRNPRSVAHLSLHISYPNEEDIARAKAAGVSPGGDIMIHGLLNGWGFLGALHRMRDWTDGCIAVTDKEMREIWSLVPDGTPIVIEG